MKIDFNMNILENTDDCGMKEPDQSSLNFHRYKKKENAWEGWYSVYEDDTVYFCLIGHYTSFCYTENYPYAVDVYRYHSRYNMKSSKRKPHISQDDYITFYCSKQTTFRNIADHIFSETGYTIHDKIIDCDKLEEAYQHGQEYSYTGFDRKH